MGVTHANGITKMKEMDFDAEFEKDTKEEGWFYAYGDGVLIKQLGLDM